MGQAPITLTPAQFAKTGAAKAGGTYGSYLRYVERARAARGSKNAPVPGGLDQTPQSSIDAAIRSIVSRFGGGGKTLAPKSDAQLTSEATGYANAQIQPVIDEVTREANARAGRGMSSIADLSKGLIAAQTPAAGGYMKDALQAAAARAAVGQTLSGEQAQSGQQAQGDVAGKLAQMGAGPDANVFADNTGKLGANLASTLGTHAATGAQDTIDRGLADAGKASALPGIASLAAIRSGRLLQEQTNAGLQDSVGKITSSVPGMVASLFENLKNQELAKAGQRENVNAQKAGAAEGLLTHLGDQNVQKAIAKMGLGVDLTKLGVDASTADTRNKIAQQNADTAAARAQAAAEKAAATASGKDANTVRIATSKALTKATSYLDKYVKPQPVYQRVLDNSTTPPTYKQVVTGYKGFPSYYGVIHAIESRVAPILSQVGLSDAEITMFVQRLVNANAHYGAGQNGRPGSGVGAPPPSRTQGDHGAPR